jgi:hypothetical protein
VLERAAQELPKPFQIHLCQHPNDSSQSSTCCHGTF